MQKADLIIKNACIITMDKERRIIDNGSIVITNDKISAIGPAGVNDKEFTAEKIIDAEGKFVFPGFINTHTHLFQVMLKGIGRDKSLFEWLDSSILRSLRYIDNECCYYAALTGCIESIRSGVTTLLDYQYCHGNEGLDDSIIQAFEDTGIRGILGRGYTRPDRIPKQYACPYTDTEENFFKDIERLAVQYKTHSRISVAMAPSILWDMEDSGFIKAGELSKKYDIPFTMHICETEDDNEYCLKTKKMRAVPYLEKMGILNDNFIAVHCVHLDDHDMELLRKYDVKVSHNPVSNMLLASGIADIPSMLKKGITVSLATDGAASNDTQDMLETMKITALLHKVNTRDSAAVSAADVLKMATIGGARALMMERLIGSLEIGKKADLFIYNPLNAKSIPINDPVCTIVYSSAQTNIETSIIDGKIVMENGKIINIDEGKVLCKTQEIAEKLVKTAGSK